MNKLTQNNLINLVFFQVVWFLTVIGAANGSLWPGCIGLAAFFAVHQWASATAGADFRLAICAVFAGLVCEAAFVRAGLLLYPTATVFVLGVPVWILILWANFALTMNGCLRWLQGKYALAALLGFMGGPLSYFGGIKLGAATVGHSLQLALASIAICYAIVTPLLLYLARHLAGLKAR